MTAKEPYLWMNSLRTKPQKMGISPFVRIVQELDIKSIKKITLKKCVNIQRHIGTNIVWKN